MKRILSLLLCCLLLTGLLAACAGQPAAQEVPASQQTEETSQAGAETAPAQEPEEAEPAETPEEAPQENSMGGVASAEDMTEVVDVVEEGMVPVTAAELKEGRWPVEMVSSSSMFRAESVELISEGGKLFALLHMTSTAYPYMFAGTAAEAAAADSADYVPLVEEADGTGSFTLPIPALDAGVECAAFSKRKELWYDRTLLFRADSLPLEAFAEGRFATAESLGLADGEYTVEASLMGGSGRASVQSPTALYVENGKCTARLVWGSSNYDYMIVDGEKLDPVTLEGGSTFLVPVAAFDVGLAMTADTTAMSQPYEIEYSIRFDSASIAPVDGQPSEAASAPQEGEAEAEEPAPAEEEPAPAEEEPAPAVEEPAPAEEEPAPAETEPTPPETEPEPEAESGIPDGTYTIEISFSGGTGKAHILSPVTLYVQNGSYSATVVWSSSNYDYMVVGGTKIVASSIDGGSTFTVPVAALDTPLTWIGDTTAMSVPHEVEYTVTFDSSTLKAVG